MNNQELFKKINEVLKNSSSDSCDETIALIEEQLKGKVEDTDKKKLLFFKKRLEIHKTEIKRDTLEEGQYKEKIHLNGQITKDYKSLMKDAPTKEEQLQMRHEYLECLKKHKGLVHEYRHDSKEKIPISEKVGLKVQEISKTIEIFLQEKDVLTKFKNTIRDTITSSASSLAILAGISLAIQALTGLPVTLTSLASAMPIVAYIGLTSTLRNFTHKTEFQQFEYQQSDEYKEKVAKFQEEHATEIQGIADLLKEKDGVQDPDKIVSINERLIALTDQLSKSCKIDGVRQAYELQSLGYYYESRACCEKIKDDYLEEVYDDKERYKENNKRLSKINLEIFKRGNSFKDAIKDTGKSIVGGTAIMMVAKAVLALVAPGMFPIDSIKSFIEPFIFLVVNGIINIPTYADKLKYRETEYDGKVKINELERIKQYLELAKEKMGMESNQPQPSLA